MKKLSVIIATVLFSIGFANAVVPTGDDTNEASHDVSIEIPTVALVDVEGAEGEAGTVNLNPEVDGLEAGSAVDFGSVSDNSLWLNYTSIIGGGEGDERTVTAEISAGSLPGGVSLVLSASTASGNGNGSLGSPVNAPVTLSATAKDLVTGIGSGYTGNGSGNGHQLTYSLEMDNESYAGLVAGSYSVTVTYTISGDE